MKMTKKDLVWRLKERPVVGEITELVRDKIITADEARNLLFNENTTADEVETIKALKKQIEFLEGLVKELSRNQHITTVPVYVDRYIEKFRPTYSPIWMTTGTSLGGTITGQNTTLTSYAQKLVN